MSWQVQSESAAVILKQSLNLTLVSQITNDVSRISLPLEVSGNVWDWEVGIISSIGGLCQGLMGKTTAAVKTFHSGDVIERPGRKWLN